LSFRAGLDYKHVRKSLGAVDDEKGVRLQLNAPANYVNSKFIPAFHGDLDYGIALPLNHSSVWFRASSGIAFGNSDDPFANFFFGGFGNNYVDYLTEKRYREFYSFPGVEIKNQFGGKNFAKMVLELNLPPIRFRRVGFTSFYLRWARLALFSSAIRTNLDGKKAPGSSPQFGAKRTFFNFGSQLDFRIVMFSRLSSTLSFGFAAAVEENQSLKDANTEFMVSLKIL